MQGSGAQSLLRACPPRRFHASQKASLRHRKTSLHCDTFARTPYRIRYALGSSWDFKCYSIITIIYSETAQGRSIRNIFLWSRLSSPDRTSLRQGTQFARGFPWHLGGHLSLYHLYQFNTRYRRLEMFSRRVAFYGFHWTLSSVVLGPIQSMAVRPLLQH